MNSTLAALSAITEHLGAYALIEPAGVTAGRYTDANGVQLAAHTLPELAVELLAWADTTTLTDLHAWRAPESDTVHLRASTELPGGIPVRLYGGVPYSAELFPDVQPDGTQPVAWSVVRAWAEDAHPAGGAAA